MASSQHAGPSVVFNPASPYQEYYSALSPRSPDRVRRGDPLQRTIIDDWRNAAPPIDRHVIEATLKRLTTELNRAVRGADNPNRNRFQVDVFGSVAWGGSTGQSSDLDLVIIDKHAPRGYEPHLWTNEEELPPPPARPVHGKGGKMKRRAPTRVKALMPKPYNVYWLQRFLSNINGGMEYRDITVVAHANTPIVKFKLADGLQADLNCNDLGGYYNSSLILAYANLSPYVMRPMVHVLKKWLMANGLNDPSGATGTASMSSYCLTLMVIAFLQEINELPNLQEGICAPVPFHDDDTHNPDIVWVGWGRLHGQAAHVWFRKTPPPGWRRRNPNLTVSEAIRAFFAYFSGSGKPASKGSTKFDCRTQFISILNSGIVNRAEPKGTATRRKAEFRRSLEGRPDKDELIKMYSANEDAQRAAMGTGISIQPIEWDEKRIVVQDPMLFTKNCAAGMSKEAVDKLLHAFDRTHNMLVSKGNAARLQDILLV